MRSSRRLVFLWQHDSSFANTGLSNGRDAVAAVPAVQHRRLTTRRQGPSHRWRQLEAGFIEENDMRPTSKGFAEDAREFVTQPAFDLLVVTFAGLAFRLLAGPAQALLENLADVFGVQGDAKALLDQACHAVGGPQLVGPTVLVERLGGGSIRVCGVGSRRVGVGGLGWVWHPDRAVFGPYVASGEWRSGGRRGCVPPRQGIRPVRPIPRHGDGGVRVRGLFLWVSCCYYTDVQKKAVAFLTRDSVTS